MAERLTKVASNVHIEEHLDKLTFLLVAVAANEEGTFRVEDMGICSHRANMSEGEFRGRVETLIEQGLLQRIGATHLEVLPLS